MFLTQFEFNVQRRESRRVLASAERIHASVLSSFPATSAEAGRILWRLDHGDHGRRELWISSPEAPDLSALVESCGWPSAQTWRTADMEALLSGLAPGQRWRFRLTANPVKVGPANGGRGKPVPLTIPGHVPWLFERAQGCGFSLGTSEEPTVMVTRSESLSFQKGRGHRVSLRLSQFDGVLEIQDPVAMRAAMTAGIGRAKAYGAGLLTLAPLS